MERTWPSSSADGVQMTRDAFGAFGDLLQVGHAAHRGCWADKRPTVAVLVKEVAR
jgi:hypothetical protein